jgi:CheY-like chemotaxis protein
MAQLLLIDDDPGTLFGYGTILRSAGHDVVTASSGSQGLEVLDCRTVDLVLSDLRLPDMSGLDILRHIRDRRDPVALVVVSGYGCTRDVVAAMQLGAADFIEKPVFEDGLLRTVDTVLGLKHDERDADPWRDEETREGREQAAHAAARLARVLVPIIDSSTDPRTIQEWSHLVFVSPGALRNWCRMAGISPRRSLVFGRLLRAVCLSQGGRHKPENLLDVVDRRTLVGLLKFAGLEPLPAFPSDVDSFLKRQMLVRDSDTLFEIRKAIEARHPRSGPAAPTGLPIPPR